MKRIVILALAAFLSVLSIQAQTTAQITGRVADPGGSTIPGAQVVLTNTDTNAVRNAQTAAEDGAFIFPSLPVGPYKLEVKKEGFQAYAQSGIVLQLASNPTINVTLQIGNLTQTVEVQADASMVETQTASVGQVIHPEEIIDLPLNGRQATQLIGLSGAAIVNTAGGINSDLEYPSSVSFSVAGSQGNETNYKLDGAPNMDYRTNIGAPMPFPDALGEFKVESSSLPADTGSRAGGAVGAITKSGTNSIHAGLFEFLRNGIMNADSYQFGATSGVVNKGVQDNLKRNQYGGIVGGPIVKNKLFYFYGIQITPERSQTNGSRTGVPTAAVEAGDFRAFLAPPCQTSQQFLNDTIPSAVSGGAAQTITTGPKSNIILPSVLAGLNAQISKKVWSLLPPTADACGTVFTLSHNINNEWQHVVKTDWQRTDKDALFARYFITNYTKTAYYEPGNLLSNSGVGLADRVQNLVLGDTHTISPTMINTFRLSFLRTATQRTSDDRIPNICDFGMRAYCPNVHNLSYAFSAPGNMGWDYENSYGMSENLGWLWHAHTFAMGFTFEHVQMNSDGTFQVNPGPSSTTGSTASYTGQSIGDFMIGAPYTYSQGNGQIGREGQNFPALYFQDNWKIARRLQMNFGVRWDPFYPQHTGYGYASDFNIADFAANKQSKVFPNSPPGMTYPGDAGFNGSSVTDNHQLQIAPRVGFVFDPTGKGDISVRGAYSYSYGATLMWNTMHVVLNPPYGGTMRITAVPTPNLSSNDPLAGGGIANPFFNFPGGNPFPTPEPPPSNFVFPTNGAFVFQDRNITPSHTQSWNLSMQKQFTKNWLVTATYIGNRTDDMWLGKNLNQATIITAGMTAPGIVSTAGMVGAAGPCTLKYGTQNIVFPTCNSTATVSGVTSTQARGKLSLLNPLWSPQISGGMLVAGNYGISNYSGMLLSTQHRLSHGFSVLANWTWSHCLDYGEGGQDLGNSFSNPNNPDQDYGNCGQDRRHLVNVSLVFQSPKLGNKWAERILGGWNTSQIYTFSTGSFFSMADGTDISLTGINSDRPDVVGDPWTAGPVAANPTCVAPTEIHTLSHWYNNCAFAKQAAMTYGNEGRNNLVGPSRWNVDSALWRTFRVSEKYRFDLRAEGFNVLNHANWSNPATSLNTGLPGFITGSSSTARILQVAMKMTF